MTATFDELGVSKEISYRHIHYLWVNDFEHGSLIVGKYFVQIFVQVITERG